MNQSNLAVNQVISFDTLKTSAYASAKIIPVVTKRFKDIAMLAIDRMERDLKGGLGKSIYSW
jgi:hypothetical protein